MPLPGVGGGAHTRFNVHTGRDSLRVGRSKWPNSDLTEVPELFLADFSAGKCSLLAFVFSGHFFGTGDVERCREHASAGEVLLVDATMLGTKSDISSDAGLRADSIRMALSLMTQFLVHGRKLLHILHFSHM